MQDPAVQPCVFILDEPHYHRVRLGDVHRVRGLALAVEGPEVAAVVFRRAGEILAETPADLPSPDIAGLVRRPRAASCRFACELRVPGGAPIEVLARLEDGSEEPLFLFDVPWVESEEARLGRLWSGVGRLPSLPPELVERTQGGRNEEAYRDSIVSGVATLEDLLRAAGAGLGDVRDVLDIGCGTGRLLAGLHLDDPSRRLVGVDIQQELVDWSRSHLPDVASWYLGPLAPSLDLPAASFDLVLLVSVLTHLPLDLQRTWLAEVRRLLRPGGRTVVTLHGDVYASLLLDAAGREGLAREGHLEAAGGPAGSNPFATFHTPAFARELFRDFTVVHFPRGRRQGETASRFPLASLQDVYVLTRA
ncbi:MAG: class I SAM-dependent methyltransferase [Thermoanaerobaculia bacterium]